MNHCYWKAMSLTMVLGSVLVACGGGSTNNDPATDSSSSVNPTSSTVSSSSCADAQLSSVGDGTSSLVAVSSGVIPASSGVIPTSSTVIPASAGISSSSCATTQTSSSAGGTSAGISSSSSAGQVSSSSWYPFKAGISYGEFTDTRDGKVYKTVIRGSTVKIEYFAQNLDIGTMVSGSSGQVQDGVIEKFCYNDDPANCEKFGGLYQWSEAMGFPNACNSNLTGSAGCANTIPSPGQLGIVHQGICPSGWHIMNTVDWSNTWDGLTHDTGVLRARAGGWNGSNTSGFSAVPGGRMKHDGTWEEMGTNAYFWLPEETMAGSSMMENIIWNSSSLVSMQLGKPSGFSIRCARDY